MKAGNEGIVKPVSRTAMDFPRGVSFELEFSGTDPPFRMRPSNRTAHRVPVPDVRYTGSLVAFVMPSYPSTYSEIVNMPVAVSSISPALSSVMVIKFGRVLF